MPRVEFEASGAGAATSLELPDGGWLLDACDEARAPVEFSCRSASCGTCRVEVIEGGDLLSVIGPEEEDVLAIFRATAHDRLACQAKVKAGPGLVRLRWRDD